MENQTLAAETETLPSGILSLKFTGPVQLADAEQVLTSNLSSNEAGGSIVDNTNTQNAAGSPPADGTSSTIVRSSDITVPDVMLSSGSYTIPTQTEPVTVYSAKATVMNMSDTSIQGVTDSDGNHAAVADMAGKTINLNDLIDKLPPEIGALFIFEDAKLILEQEARRITFTGTLKMDGPMLGAFKSFLKMDSNPVITASIDAAGQDISTKLRPGNITFSCAFPTPIPLSSSIVLSDSVFQLKIEKVKDAVTNVESWTVSPGIAASLTFTSLAASPVVMVAKIEYGTDGLSVSAAIDQVNKLFNINNLNLNGLTATFKAGSETSVDLAASFNVGSRSFAFAGKVTSSFIGLTASASSFTSDDLSSIFRTLSGNALSLPSYGVNFENVTIGIASAAGSIGDMELEAGVQLSCHLTVHDHACEAKAVISPDYVLFQGAIQNVQIGPVSLDEVRLNMQYAAISSTKTTGFSLVGKMHVKNVELTGKVAYEKTGPDWNCIIYAGFASDTFRLSTLFPETAGTFPDSIRFSKVAVVYASKDITTQDPDFGFPVKQGLQLTGILEELPALSTLLKNKSLGMQLTALMNGTSTSISIAMPENTRLNLGRSVTCDPFTIAVQLTPQPELDLIFGVTVQIANQQQPLHFDFKLGINAIGANGSGTMKGYWKNPFGLTGLQIGPELALQADIIYAQFLSMGTPSGFGFAGGIMLGDVAGKMALSIQENPTNEILYGEIDNLSPANLIKFANGIANVSIPTDAIPDFFELKQLKLYCAPAGGTIGTITYPQGFSFACDMILFSKKLSVFANVNSGGVSASGHLDAFEVGPLKVTGEVGKDVQMNLQLNSSKQSVLVDGAIELMGIRTGVFVEVSKQSIAFKLEQNFVQLLKYSIAGKSSGSLSSPATIDFDLAAVFDSSITDFLRTTVAGRINDALKQTNKSIGDLQADLDAKKAAYEKIYNPALDKLNKAQADADAYLKQCQQKVVDAQRDMDSKIKDAKDKVAAAQANYDAAFKRAQDAFTKAQNEYNAAFDKAQREVARTKTEYDNAFATANQRLTDAQRDYDNKIGDAQNKVRSAQNDVNSLQNQVNDMQWKYDNCHWYEKAGYGTALLALKGAKGTADGVLSAAYKFLDSFKNSSEAIALGAARTAVNAANTVTKGYYDAAVATLNAVQTTGKAPLNAASQALTGIQNGVEMASLKAAQATLDTANSLGRATLNTANDTLSKVGSSAAYAALTVAKGAVNAAKTGSAAVAFDGAKAALEGAKLGADSVLKLSAYVASHSGDLIDVKHIDLSAKLSAIKRGELFKANVNVVVLSKPYQWSLDFDVKNTAALIETMFQKTFDQAKKNAGI